MCGAGYRRSQELARPNRDKDELYQLDGVMVILEAHLIFIYFKTISTRFERSPLDSLLSVQGPTKVCHLR